MYVPVTRAMASVSGTPAYGNLVFIPEAHALTLAKCKDYNRNNQPISHGLALPLTLTAFLYSLAVIDRLC
jgi:hypothetical protein